MQLLCVFQPVETKTRKIENCFAQLEILYSVIWLPFSEYLADVFASYKNCVEVKRQWNSIIPATHWKFANVTFKGYQDRWWTFQWALFMVCLGPVWKKNVKGIQEYLQNKINFTEPGWNHNLSDTECLVHIKCVGNSRAFII